jgi:transglutaminase-like putative cysteine protease
MAIHVALSHKTHYRYDRPVSLSPHIVRLRPAPHCRTPIVSYSLNVTPRKHFINWQQDPHSNYLARLVFPERMQDLSIEVDVVAEMSVFNPFDFFLEPAAERIPFEYEPWLRKELTPFLETDASGPAFRGYVAALTGSEGRRIDVLVVLNRRVS